MSQECARVDVLHPTLSSPAAKLAGTPVCVETAKDGAPGVWDDVVGEMSTRSYALVWSAVVLRTMPTSQNRDMGHPVWWLG